VVALHESSGRVDAVEVWHADIHQYDFRPERSGRLDRFVPVSGLADHFEIGFGPENHAEARADERLIICDQDTDHPLGA
jgi:hypothetical protein